MKRHTFSFFKFRLRKPAARKMPLQPFNGRRSAGSEQGVALVITLILLSVVTFMAVTFLVVSRSEKGAVGATTDQTIARMAADAALERAKTEAMARIMGFTNPFNFDLLVSTNYINPAGFKNNNNSYTNVSYNYANGAPVSGVDALQNISHLLYNPRVPVVITNRFAANSNEFRFYLDLNRNGRYDTNGYSAVISANGGFFDTNGFPMAQPVPGRTLSNYFVGDPEWIGGLERADLPHSSSNQFIYRYAYVVVPASKTLDVNYIHNYARLLNGNMSPGSGDGFIRNQGVGTWEINLAAFLTDLNTNYWPFPLGNINGTPYNYMPFDLSQPNRGAAFDDALGFMRYRYNRDWRNWLPSLQAYFNDVNNGPVVSAVSSDFFDAYSRGPIMTNTSWPVRVDGDRARVNFAWSGSDNPNSFFTTQEYFDPAKTSVQFSNRLWSAGRSVDSYDRYTYYRLLSELGTDSSLDQPGGKINLNYDNVFKSNRFSYARSATNFLPWRPIDFFHASASKMLANAGYDPSGNSNPPARVSINHIQIYPTNFYTPSVHQILQMAANMYDATITNTVPNFAALGPVPPTVFKPLFAITNGQEIFISGFEEVTNADQMVRVGIPWRDLSIPANRDKVQPGDMIYGMPLIIGARKGFPNFNELAMQTSVQVTRKLEFRRGSALPGAKLSETNQMYTLTISNVFGLEAWNSYSNAYPRRLQMRAFVDMFASLWETNETTGAGKLMSSNYVPRLTASPFISFAASNWPGYVNPQYAQASFQIPFHAPTNSFHYVSNRVYRSSTKTLDALSGIFERNQGFPVPRWYLHLRTRVRYYLIDTDVNRIVDFVNLDSTDAPLDIAQILSSDGACSGSFKPDAADGSMWCTNRMGNNINYPTFGIENQIGVGLGLAQPQNWNNFQTMAPVGLDRVGAIDFFRVQFGLSARTYPGQFSETNVFYAPFAPTRTIYYQTSWQANDPLVHYNLGDLVDYYDNFQTNRIRFENLWATNNMGSINKRFEPWGGNPAGSSSASPTAKDWAVKDPMVTRSDDWDFPTNKFPNVGWLGRVHRGTPWQTINLKSPVTNYVTWMKWSGNGSFDRNVGQFNTNVVPFNFITNDAAFSHPINDRYILDLFTTSINDNATRGQLSVNQTNLAAWSAVLSGVNVMPDALTNTFIAPAGIYNPTSLPPVAQIVQGIQRTQTLTPGGYFPRLGDVLATPELTVASPFLSHRTNLQNDAVYERIPQQILGLLKGADEPRFVIYSFGQALKPANRSQVSSGQYSGMITNYQVVAEVATRSVVRIEGLPKYPSPVFPQTPPFARQKPYSNLRAVVERFNILPPE